MTGGEDEGKRRQANERAQYLRVTTDLTEDEALAVAWKEMGYAAPAIARFVGCAPVTIDKRLDRAVAQYGFEAAGPTIEEERGDLEEITPAYFEGLSEGVIDRYRKASVQHSQHVPAAVWEIVQRNEDEDNEDDDQGPQTLFTDGGTDIEDHDADWIDDPDFDGSVEAVRGHYQRARPVSEAFSDLEGYPTTGFIGNSGWYHKRSEYELEFEELEAGYREHRRAYTFERDYDHILAALAADDDNWRSAYNIASWKDREAVYDGAFSADGSYEQGEGLAGYGEMRGFPPWVDLDLEDNDHGEDGPNWKRRRGQLTDDQRGTVERTLEAYVKEFATLCGIDPADIAVFDSGGGMYLYGPAAVTLPIADHFEDDHGPHGDARALLFRELRKRMFAYGTGESVNADASDYDFEGIETRVNDRVPAASDLLSPDWMQNRNRQSKAPLAIHGSHDVVVTPARNTAGTVEYDPTPVSAVDDELIEHTIGEVEKIVGTPDTETIAEMTESFVSTLFADYYEREGVDEWHDALAVWLQDERDATRRDAHQEALEAREQQRRFDGLDGEKRTEIADRVGKDVANLTPRDTLAGKAVTPLKKDVFDALADRRIVDVHDVIRRYASNAYSTSDRGHETTFDPSWRGSSSGKSCAIRNGENRFIDNGCDGGGGPAKAYALGTGIIPREKNAAARPLKGRAWGEAVDGLREAGYPIPVHVPETGEEYDETPLWALRNAAVALDVCGADDFTEHETEDGETYLGFDRETYNATLDVLEEQNIDHGRDPVTGTEAVSALPLAQLDALSPTERRRYARKRGLDWPSTDDARTRLFDTITGVMADNDSKDTVIDAPTSLGKSHVIAATDWGAQESTGNATVVHASKTTDARDEATDTSDAAGVPKTTLKSSKELCPARRGDLDGEITIDGHKPSVWFEIQCEQKGVPFGVAHSYFEQYNDQGHPHTCGDTCPYIAQMEHLANGDLPPLVHCTHNFVHVPRLRLGTHLAWDEQPDFTLSVGAGNTDDITETRIRTALNAYLEEIDAPVTTWEEFIVIARTEWQPATAPGAGENDKLLEQKEELENALGQPPADWYLDCPDAHALIHPIATALLTGEKQANARYRGRTSYTTPWTDESSDHPTPENWLTIVLDGNNNIRTLRDTPGLAHTQSVIGLDAHPEQTEWAANTVPWIKTENVLDADERQLWRRYERGLRVVQVGGARRPLSSTYAVENYIHDDKLVTELSDLHDQYGEEFTTAITTRRAKETLETAMKEAGIENPTVMTFGNARSNNAFAGESVGFVYGCHDPGDDHVVDRLAELRLEAEPVHIDCPTCDGGGCGDCDSTGRVREHGRTFDGPDADTADEILAAVQHNQVAQAAGRYARSPDDPDDIATVYVATSAVPSGFADVSVNGAFTTFGPKQQAIAHELREATDRLSAADLAERTDTTKRHVNETLRNWHERGVVDAYTGAGKYGATLYTETGLPERGVSDLSPVSKIGNSHVLTPYTWQFVISSCPGLENASASDEPPPTEATETNQGDQALIVECPGVD